MASVNKEDGLNCDESASTSIECEIESVAAIRKFIEAQEKELQDEEREKQRKEKEIKERKSLAEKETVEETNDDSMDSKLSQSETISVASSVIEMMITESELESAKKRDIKSKILSPDKGNSSMALSVGSKVEAKDFTDYWHTAEIIEVDYDEMEVLVHYEIETKKHDEWINVSSPRLRPLGSATVKPGPSSTESLSSDVTPPVAIKVEPKDDMKVEDKAKLTFVVGERCLARWRDNRRFMATICNVLENGSYEIIFDDGCQWTCKVSRLYKLKPEKDGVSSGASNTPDVSSPQYEAGPGNTPGNTYPVYHTHLFDPTRDYLGSKSERREMKRKLNIKEIFNIGQKRQKTQRTRKEMPQKSPVERKPRIRKGFRLKHKVEVKAEVKTENAVDAVASIIGTLNEDNIIGIKEELADPPEATKENPSENEVDIKDDNKPEINIEAESKEVITNTENTEESDKVELEDLKPYLDPEVLEEEVKLEQFEKPDEGTHEEVIDRIKEAINKLEDGLKVESTSISSPKPEIKIEIPKIETPEVKPEIIAVPELDKTVEEIKDTEKNKKKLTKVKKGKKLRLLREKKVKKQVEKVKSELEEMRKQVEEMRLQMLRSQEMSKDGELPESFLLPGEWCCRWMNGQPVGTVSEIECEMKYDPNGKPPLPRRSVQVEDKRLPEGWTKHMVRRSLGHSAGKWDVVIVSPDNKRFHTKNEMRLYLESIQNINLKGFEHALTDFGVHLKLARRMGWISHTPDGVANGPNDESQPKKLSSMSPLVKRRQLGLSRKGVRVKNKIPKLTIKMNVPTDVMSPEDVPVASTSAAMMEDIHPHVELNMEQFISEDGYVYVGRLKVQVIDNLLRCPAEGCLKNFRNNTLLRMHIKHYHRELKKMMGKTPKVLDLAYARTMPGVSETPRTKDEQKVMKVKTIRPTKFQFEDIKQVPNEDMSGLHVEAPTTPDGEIAISRNQDSPKLRQALITKPVKRPRVLLPVRKVDPEKAVPDSMSNEIDFEIKESLERASESVPLESLDFETAISTHTVTKPVLEKKRKGEKKKKKKAFVLPPKALMSEEEEWLAMNSDVDTRSSLPRSGTPDPKMDIKPTFVSESNEENKDANMYTYNENGERIKIVHMKREEIINCHCGYREEDGLMVQCELCLCWQHALCHNIQRETDVPEKYTCSICLNPRRGRRSKRFLHDQDRMYEGLLPSGRPDESLRRSHELTGNLLRIEDALHALRVKYYVATKKDHPKLYLWAKDWEHAEIQYTQEKLNSDYSDLNIIISNIGKENLPIKPDDVKDIPLDIRTSLSEDNEHDRFSQRDMPIGSQSLLSGLLSSPGGTSLDLPISTLELERLAKTVQEQECQRSIVTAPQPEAAIENSACRERLLKHIQRCQALIDARLDSIEAQVAELESQDPSFEDDETADYFPRTKQTIQMLMRDLNTMEELGVVT